MPALSMSGSDMQAYIHSFESLAALDGEGLRCAVFFAGCPLRCACCHNPDTWSENGQAIESGALLKKIMRYRPYFQKDGGVTFSGGEPLLQAAFINELGRDLCKEGISYTLDTSGAVPLTENVQKAVAQAQLVILDVKYPNAALYRQYTKGDFSVFLQFADLISKTGKRVWYRTVVIPGVNDTPEMIDAYARLISRWNKPEKYELLAFHTMGFYKYEQLGIQNPLHNTKPMEMEKLRELQRYLDQKIN